MLPTEMPNIVIIGSECSGKTSLAQKLASELHTEFLEEASRSYALQKNGELTYSDVMPIAHTQQNSERAFMKGGNEKWKIFDTCLLSTLVYSKIYYEKVPDE